MCVSAKGCLCFYVPLRWTGHLCGVSPKYSWLSYIWSIQKNCPCVFIWWVHLLAQVTRVSQLHCTKAVYSRCDMNHLALPHMDVKWNLHIDLGRGPGRYTDKAFRNGHLWAMNLGVLVTPQNPHPREYAARLQWWDCAVPYQMALHQGDRCWEEATVLAYRSATAFPDSTLSQCLLWAAPNVCHVFVNAEDSSMFLTHPVTLFSRLSSHIDPFNVMHLDRQGILIDTSLKPLSTITTSAWMLTDT